MTTTLDHTGAVGSIAAGSAGVTCGYLTQSGASSTYRIQTAPSSVPGAMSSFLGVVGQAVSNAAGSLGSILSGQYSPFARRSRTAWIEEFLEIASLKDGWNGVGSLAPSEESLRAALQTAMAADGRGGFTLTPNDNGTISLEWEASGGYALLELGRSRYSISIEPSSGARYFDNGLFSSAVISSLLSRIGAGVFRETTGLIDAARIAPMGLMTSVHPTFYVRSA